MNTFHITNRLLKSTLFCGLLLFSSSALSCSSDDDAPEPPKPSGYDIYTAGYKTPSGKSVATVWKNGTEMALEVVSSDNFTVWGLACAFVDTQE